MEIVTVDGTAVVGVELLEDDVVERRHLGRERRRFGAPEASVRVGNLSQPPSAPNQPANNVTSLPPATPSAPSPSTLATFPSLRHHLLLLRRGLISRRSSSIQLLRRLGNS
jgi:hypothetical protein